MPELHYLVHFFWGGGGSFLDILYFESEEYKFNSAQVESVGTEENSFDLKKIRVMWGQKQ